jgi:hypothetical protein
MIKGPDGANRFSPAIATTLLKGTIQAEINGVRQGESILIRP